jgi:predicted Zn-dependent protease
MSAAGTSREHLHRKSASHPILRMKSLRSKSLLIVAALTSFAWAQSAGPVFPNPGKPSMSRENQQALGMQAAAQVYKQMPVLPDNSPETVYVRQLGEKLVATIPAQYSWPFDFHVIPQKEINAFALPGGPMFINIGTLTASANEAQLAGVMAHEMSHVYMQHSAKQAGKAQTTGLIAGLASAALGMTVGDMAGGLVGQLGQAGIQMGAQGLSMKYSRSDESQADAVGAMILYKAGYNPQAMADFFKTLETEGGSAPPQWLSDHPNPANRQQAIAKEIQPWPAKDYTADTPGFARVREQASHVKAYTAQEIAQGAKSGQWTALNEKNGATFAGAGSAVAPTRPQAQVSPVSLQSVTPSKNMVAESIGPINLHRPANWPVTPPQKQGQFVTIAPQAGINEKGIGYGVLLNGIGASQAKGLSIDQVTAQLIQQMQRNNGFQSLSQPETITVGGLQGRSVMFNSESPFPAPSGQPQKERDWLVTIPQRSGAVIFMIFIAPEDHFSRIRPTYDDMLKSMQFR